MRDALEIQITDLDTALYLANLDFSTHTRPSSSIRSSTSIITSPLFQQIRSISICLVMEIEKYKKLDTPKPSSQSPRESVGISSEDGSVEVAPEVEIWHQVWPRLATLPHLSNLSVWLDHDSLTWADIDERPLLRPIATANWGSQVRVTVRMPNLPKDKIRPDFHYSKDNREEGLSFRIVRRERRPEVTPLDWNWIGFCPDIEEDAKDEDWGCCYDRDSMHLQFDALSSRKPQPIPQPKGWWMGI